LRQSSRTAAAAPPVPSITSCCGYSCSLSARTDVEAAKVMDPNVSVETVSGEACRIQAFLEEMPWHLLWARSRRTRLAADIQRRSFRRRVYGKAEPEGNDVRACKRSKARGSSKRERHRERSEIVTVSELLDLSRNDCSCRSRPPHALDAALLLRNPSPSAGETLRGSAHHRRSCPAC